MALNRYHVIPDLSRRAVSLELMDNRATDESELFATLKEFNCINRFLSRVPRVLNSTVFADMRIRKVHEVSFLDVGAGGGDAAVWFARRCRRSGIRCTIYCLDIDPRVLRFARNACRGEQSIRFIQADARDIGRLNLKVDYAFSNHFFHHLSDNDIPEVLRAVRETCRYGFAVHDLDRFLAWYIGFSFMSRMFWREGFIRDDGRMSIRRGFRRAELEGYVSAAGIDGAISRSGLGHWLITNLGMGR